MCMNYSFGRSIFTWVRAESEWLLFVGRSTSSLTSSTRRIRTFRGNLYLSITSISFRTSKGLFLSLKTLILLHSLSISSSAKYNTAAILFIYVHVVPLTARRVTSNSDRNSENVTFCETDVSATFTFTSTFTTYDTLVKRSPGLICVVNIGRRVRLQ